VARTSRASISAYPISRSFAVSTNDPRREPLQRPVVADEQYVEAL
jgi:hypothetical protein